MDIERKRYNRSFIGIAPLVDIVFLLLLFFLLTSHLIKETSIKVTLPESETATDEEKAILVISINGKVEIYIANIKTRIEDLDEAMSGLIEGKKTDFIQIKADRDASVGILVSVIDQVRKTGITNYSILTERKQ